MPIKFKYNTVFTFFKDYLYVVSTDNEKFLSSVNISATSDVDTNVSAYAFGNVDAFGSQALCWYDNNALMTDISTSLYQQLNSIKSKMTDYEYSLISSHTENDIAQAIIMLKPQWISVNNRSLRPI